MLGPLFNELDLLLEYLRDMLELKNPDVPQKLALEYGILPVVDVLAARDEVRVVGDNRTLNGAVGLQSLILIGPAASNPVLAQTLPGEWTWVMAVRVSQTPAAGGTFRAIWTLSHQNTAPAIDIPLRAISTNPGETYGGDGANVATPWPLADPIQPAPTRLTQPWVIPPDYILSLHLGSLAAGQAATINTVAAIFPRGSKPVW